MNKTTERTPNLRSMLNEKLYWYDSKRDIYLKVYLKLDQSEKLLTYPKSIVKLTKTTEITSNIRPNQTLLQFSHTGLCKRSNSERIRSRPKRTQNRKRWERGVHKHFMSIANLPDSDIEESSDEDEDYVRTRFYYNGYYHYTDYYDNYSDLDLCSSDDDRLDVEYSDDDGYRCIDSYLGD